MSSVSTKGITQLVVGGTTQPIKLGGVANDLSDYKMQIASDGAISTTTSLTVPSLVVNSQPVMSSLLASYTVTGSPVTSIDFSGLDINTHKSYRVEFNIANATATGGEIDLFINGDTTNTNYYNEEFLASHTSVSSGRNNFATVSKLDASNRVAGFIGITRDTAGYCMACSQTARSLSAGLTMSNFTLNKTATVTNITQLTFTASVANSIGVGSTIRLYRGDV